MSDFLARRLADAELAARKRAEDRKALWLEIKTRAPVMAEHLSAIRETFGKFVLLSIDLRSNDGQ